MGNTRDVNSGPGWLAVGDGTRMSTPRDAHSAILCGRPPRVLLVGGRVSPEGATTAACDWFDPRARRFSPAPSMIGSRSFFPAIGLPNGRVLVVGGYRQEKDGGTIRACELFDPEVGEWRLAASLSTSRELHTTTILPDGRLLAVGGFSNNKLLDTTETYDPGRNAWTTAPAMSRVRFGHTATLLVSGRNRGKVLVAGGRGENDVSRSTTELYDARTDSWSPGPDMNEPRFRHTATLLKDGRILVAGGYNHDPASRACLDTAEIYNPETNLFTPLAQTVTLRDGFGNHKEVRAVWRMSSLRMDHTATLLPDGTVLIAGGWSSAGRTVGSVDLFRPRLSGKPENPFRRLADLPASRHEHAAIAVGPEVLVTGGLQWEERERATLDHAHRLRAGS